MDRAKHHFWPDVSLKYCVSLTNLCFCTFPLSVLLRGGCGCVCGLHECDWTQPAAREDWKPPGALHVCRRKLLHRDRGPALLLNSVHFGPQGSSWTHQALWLPERGRSGQWHGAFDWWSCEAGVNRQSYALYFNGRTSRAMLNKSCCEIRWSQERLQNLRIGSFRFMSVNLNWIEHSIQDLRSYEQ